MSLKYEPASEPLQGYASLNEYESERLEAKSKYLQEIEEDIPERLLVPSKPETRNPDSATRNPQPENATTGAFWYPPNPNPRNRNLNPET